MFKKTLAVSAIILAFCAGAYCDTVAIGKNTPDISIAGKRNRNVPIMACCWFSAKVDMSVPTLTVVHTNTRAASKSRTTGPRNGTPNTVIPMVIMNTASTIPHDRRRHPNDGEGPRVACMPQGVV